ncbi:IQ calmodulin-binding motif-containing protein 1 [Pantherophis guttatus]|uniref:IQ calmodulin-binding motif-containing protein 1 n=1 Tax=Pantherophis guttatus TaxID=94885 RepID=A0A6P9CHB5_PANGU|nr:IQ calmodulin-binding motif-containing protein 1 [Pantherophis guttatus]
MLCEMKPLPVDSRILSLTAQITESPDQDIPVLLLKLKEILTSASPGSNESKKIKQDLYYYDLVQYCLLVLKKDYTKVPGGWTTAAQIAEILSQCCVGLEVKTEREEFYSKLLPSAVDSLLFLGRRLQAQFVRAIKDEKRNEFLHCFRTVTDAICWLCRGHIHLVENVLQNKHFQQLLTTDDAETTTQTLSLLQNILRTNSKALVQITEEALHFLLDELIYKISSTTNPARGNATVKLLLLITESDAQLVITVNARYKGLHTLLSKQWTGKGFDKNLNQLLDLLDAENSSSCGPQKMHQAACLIQASWRGYQTRKRLRQLPKAITILQRKFRAKREEELQSLKRQREEECLRQQLQLQRQRAMRLFHERQLTLLEIVHAGQIDKHMHEMKEKAALTIQRYWRAFKARRNFHQQKRNLKEYKAAVLIQRAVLKFLEKKRRKAYSLWKQPESLSDEQRISLQQKVESYIKLHPASAMSEEMSRELHHQAQEKLAHYMLRKRKDQKAKQHREALLAQVHTDVDQLLSAPSLSECTMKDLNVFMSRSVPVVAKAKQSHNTILKYMQWPWWKKLEEDFFKEEVDSVDPATAELETLFIGGSRT